MVNGKNLFYFDISIQNIDEVVDIFTRINSGGMILKKSDLLFSILVSKWPEGREEIKDLIETLNAKGLEITQDFIMRACLVLSDLPVKYKLESFTTKNTNKIRTNWPCIRDSLYLLCNLMLEIGYSSFSNISENALIPIAYYIFKQGEFKSSSSRKTLQKYYVVSQVNGIFGGQADQVMEKIRSEIKRQLESQNKLDYDQLCQLRLPGNKSFRVTEERLKELISETRYGNPHAYFLLSLIYPTVDLKIKKYQVDHIHPQSKFNKTNLTNNGLTDIELIEDWIKSKKDLLPNLQLLAFGDNNNKRSKTILQYLKDKSREDRMYFIKENLLPGKNKILELINFDDFFDYRTKRLYNKLKSCFGL